MTTEAPPQPKDIPEVILVAEDSAPNRQILCHLIKQFGYEVIEAKDGKEALKLLLGIGPDKKLVGIFSDLMMPEMDGIQLLKAVRENEKFKGVFFTLVTAVADKQRVLDAKQYEVDGYVLKPVSYDKIQKKLISLSRFAGK